MRTLTLGLVLACSLAPLGPVRADDRLVSEGRGLFVRHCASCHGAQGRGDGPIAGDLRTKPADLTRLRTPGGRFPYGELREIIDGRREVATHGPRDMPVWGRLFKEEIGDDPGSEVRVSGEITALLAFIESIQVDARENE